MNKLVLGIVIVIVGALSTGVWLATGNDDDVVDNLEVTQTDEQAGAEMNAPENEATARPVDESVEVAPAGMSGLQEYSQAALANSTTEKNLIFFHAAWCSVCNAVEQNLEASNIPDTISIFQVDYDSPEGQALADKYNIPIQYTMVQVDTDGAELTQWVNTPRDGIDQVVERLI